MRWFLFIFLLIALSIELLPSSTEDDLERITKYTFPPLAITKKRSFATEFATIPLRPERERRDVGVYPFLAPAIGTEGNSSCSGTIVYYDEVTGTGYVIACAHSYKGSSEKPKVITYFINDKRQMREFDGSIIAIDPKKDLADITFHPNFIPQWIPIGPKDSAYYRPTEAPVGRRVIVTGRDAGLPGNDRRPAAYEAFIREDDDDNYLESRQSQSRKGRSGGGVITANGQWLIGVNHGRGKTVRGIGHGLWIPLHQIHSFLEQNNLKWLIEVTEFHRRFPIVDETKREFPKEYIPRTILDNQYTPLRGKDVTAPTTALRCQAKANRDATQAL